MKRKLEWCQQNKVFDEIIEEINEIWQKECPDEDEVIRQNGKCIWEAAKRVYDFKNVHEDIIHNTTFGKWGRNKLLHGSMVRFDLFVRSNDV